MAILQVLVRVMTSSSRLGSAFLTLAALLGPLAVAAAAPRTLALTIHGHALHVEVAETPAERVKGLSGRRQLTGDGMLFVYRKPQRLSFWMKDTHFPLAIAFINSAGIIVDIQQMTPDTLTSHQSPMPAQYALEAAPETFRRLGVKAGTRVEWLPEENRTRGSGNGRRPQPPSS